MRKNKGSSFVAQFLICFFAALLGGAGYLLFNDTLAPVANISPESGQVSLDTNFKLDVVDEKTGLKSVYIVAKQGEKSFEIAGETLLAKEKAFSKEFNIKDLGLGEGAFTVEVVSLDASYAKILGGNESIQSFTFDLDAKPPKISMLSGPANIKRGGAGMVSYKVSEDVQKTGIVIDGQLFPAFPASNSKAEAGEGDKALYYNCLFPFPFEVSIENFKPQIMAQDLAGNITTDRLITNSVDYVYPTDVVKISDNFLRNKEDEFRKILPDSDEPVLELYKKINNDIRKENQKAIIEIVKGTAPTFYWSGAFQQQPRSVSRANYGDSRTYMYNGEKIDFQTHMGLDLASTTQDIVRASNKGKVIFADYLGIYGYTVILDHGRNLQTLYSHCTTMNVEVGDIVEKNADLGTSGISGLAVGDHVHFGVLVGGVAVQPLEWLDAVWVRNNITSRMNY